MKWARPRTKQNDWNVDDPAGNERGHEQRSRRNGCDLEASQDVCFTLLDGTQSCTKEAVPQDAHHENQRDNVGDRAAPLSSHETCKHEKENERKEVVEENDRLIAKGELQIYFDEGQVAFHLGKGQ